MIEVDALSRELATIAAEALKAPEDEEDIFKSAPHYRLFFEELRGLVCDAVIPEDELILDTAQLTLAASEPSSVLRTSEFSSNDSISPTPSKKRPNSLTITTSSPTKVRHISSPQDDAIPRTPDQTTASKDPKYSGESIESTDEDNTKGMIKTFIRTTLSHLGGDFRRISWPSYARKCRLSISGSLKISLYSNK